MKPVREKVKHITRILAEYPDEPSVNKEKVEEQLRRLEND